jgi:hypothetical protein
MARTWICDNPNHSGVLAPERMRADDVRRFCWPCSLETGRLVKRHAPALERERERGRVAKAARARQKREKAREHWIVKLNDARGRERELDVRAELRRALTDMGFFDGWSARSKPTIDDLNITIRRGDKHYHTGRAVLGGFDVWFTFGSNASYEGGLELIYHEAAHLASPYQTRTKGVRLQTHTEGFHRILADGLQKRWPWIVYGSLAPRQPGGCWAMGRRIISQMEQRTRDGLEL